MSSGITPERLRRLLDYDPGTGWLWWKSRPRAEFKSDRAYRAFEARNVGKRAFTATTRNGYKTGRADNKQLFAHRVIWAIVHGEWPPEDIDHINGDKSDNRILNLRIASRSDNCKNRAGWGASRYLGVSRAPNGKWRARINLHGKERGLGVFNAEEEAFAAYLNAAKALHGEFVTFQRMP
jgi:hypothetical protein